MKYAWMMVFLATQPVWPLENQSTFMTKTPEELNWKGVKNPIPVKGNYFLPTGTVFDAVLENAIFSYNLMTPTVAFIEDDIPYLNQIIFPRGTRFIGTVQVLHSLDRVQIDFHTCVFPDGQEIRISLLALSLDGSAGIKGKVEKHKDAVAAKVAMRSVLTGVQAGTSVAAPTVENSMTAGLSQEALTMLGDTKAENLESISIEERTPVKLFLKGRIDF